MIAKSAARWARSGFGLAAFSALVAFSAGSAPANAQTAPGGVVTLVIPFAAGGTTDVLGRVVGHELAIALGQTVIIENRPGAAGANGSVAVAKSKPDGSVILLGAISTHAINPALYAKLNYDPEKDFIPISYICSYSNVLVVSPKRIKATTIQEFVEEAKKSPGGLNMASSGTGSSPHLSGEMFKMYLKTNMVHVPYRGAGPAVNDLLGGSVDYMFDNTPNSLPHIQAGTLRGLAVTSKTRDPSLPDIPTVDETVIPGFEVIAWFALFAPAGTPADVIGKFRTAVSQVLAKPELKKRLATLGATTRAMSDQEFLQFLDQERTKWAEVVRAAGVRVE